MSENGNGRLKKACLAIFTNGHVIISGASLLTIGGSVGGVYASLHSAVTATSKAESVDHAELDAIRTDLRRLRQDARETARALENWERDEKAHDAEIRTMIDGLKKGAAIRK